MSKYIGKATACILYAISQHDVLILYNPTKNVMAAILKKPLRGMGHWILPVGVVGGWVGQLGLEIWGKKRRALSQTDGCSINSNNKTSNEAPKDISTPSVR